MKNFRVVTLVVFLFTMAQVTDTVAQCSMCRQIAESNLKQGENKRGAGLNNAILYLMAVPYILGGVGGYIIWKNRKK